MFVISASASLTEFSSEETSATPTMTALAGEVFDQVDVYETLSPFFFISKVSTNQSLKVRRQSNALKRKLI